ncbi:MAG: TetR/AcrR family transcriptional regulator [Pseudomonadota bacterium]
MRAPQSAQVSELPAGNIKVTRQDWLNCARARLIQSGIAEVKILSLGAELGVSRSSFYWYFESRQDLCDALLAEWENTNTAILRQHAAARADTITQAVCNLFRCFVNPTLFDQQLDFAVREWSRRDAQVRQVIDRSDQERIEAITQMFERFGVEHALADVRARVLYFMQIGYYALDLAEPIEERLARTRDYLFAFTGEQPRDDEIAALRAYALEVIRE